MGPLSCVPVIILASVTLLSVQVTGLESFFQHEVVPDVIPIPPKALLSVKFISGVEAKEGNVLEMSQVQQEPIVTWDAVPGVYYTICMVDPDAPSRFNATARSHRHWLVVNIEGADVASGEALTTFLPSHPPPGSGFHRYIFLVYQQDGLVEVHEEWMDTTDGEQRSFFSVSQFAEKYQLSGPIAGNFYICKSDESQ